MTHGRHELAADLRALITRANLTPAEVSRRIGVSEATMSRYVNGKTAVAPKTVRAVITACGLTGDVEAEQTFTLAEDVAAGSASRVVILRRGSGTSQRRFGALEKSASHTATFTALVVPGLLQTERYMREVFAVGGLEGAALDKAVRGRLDRQEVMRTSDSRYTQITTEGALRWQARSSDLMAEQVDHIAALASQDWGGRVRVGVIPWTVPVDLFPLTNFDLYDDTRAVVVGTDFGTSFLDRSADVAVYVRQFSRLSELALFGLDAVPVLERIADDYRQQPD